MFKNGVYVNAGTNEIYRYDHKAVEKVEKCLEPNEKGKKFIQVLNSMIAKMKELDNARFEDSEEEQEEE